MKSLSLCCLSLFVFAQCVHSLPSSFDATQVKLQVVNSSGIFGDWKAGGLAPSIDASKSCGVWSQSDKKNGLYYCSGYSWLTRGWIETIADISNLNGLNKSSAYYGAIRILNVQSNAGGNIAAVNIWPSVNGTGFSGYIMNNWGIIRETEFSIPSGFHRYTLGYDYETFNISVYIDNVLVSSKRFNSFNGTYGAYHACGYEAGNMVSGTGTMYIKECSMYRPTVKTVYVDGSKGLDTNDGFTKNTPLKTITAASEKAMKGTTIYVADGIYRESFSLPSGEEGEPVSLIGSGKNVYVSGSVAATDFKWTKDTKTNIWSANVSSVFNKAPIIATYRDKKTHEFVRVYQARTPNFRVDTPWKFTEFWSEAQGGSKIMDCFGQDDCNDTSRSTNMLADEKFKTMDDLVGGRLFATNCQSDHHRFDNAIIKHDKVNGVITIDEDMYFGHSPPFGMHSQYFVYGKRFMIDAEGEYAYEDGKLYIKWSEDQLPNQLEFSVTLIGLNLQEKSYINVQNIHFSHFESTAISEHGGYIQSHISSHEIRISECFFEYCFRGITIMVYAGDTQRSTYNWYIDHCSFTYIDNRAIFTYINSAELFFPHIPYSHIWVTNNYFYHLNFDSTGCAGIEFISPRDVYFLNNTVNYTSHNGVYFHSPVSRDGVHTTGNCLIRGNLIDGSCSGNPDCGCIKIEWVNGTNRVWKNMLVMENLCENSFGWNRMDAYRKVWFDRCYGGEGVYLDSTTGVVIYRNIVYNVGVYNYHFSCNLDNENPTYTYNNLGVGAMIGLAIRGVDDQQNAYAKNNVIVDAGKVGSWNTRNDSSMDFEKLNCNNNLYYRVAWQNKDYYGGILVVQDADHHWLVFTHFKYLHEYAPNVETTNYSFDPKYGSYDSTYNLSYDERHRISYFDDGIFNVTEELIDKGTETLPDAVIEVLDYFGIGHPKTGKSYDLGPYEKGIESWIPSSRRKIIESDSSSSSSSNNNLASVESKSYYCCPIFPLILICLILFQF